MLAPVIDLDQARRRLTARKLLALGVPLTTITATRSDLELDQLWRRETTIASLRHLTGQPRWILDQWPTSELEELHTKVIQQLMSSKRVGEDRLIYSIGGHQPHKRQQRRAQKLRAWGINPAA